MEIPGLPFLNNWYQLVTVSPLFLNNSIKNDSFPFPGFISLAITCIFFKNLIAMILYLIEVQVELLRKL